MKIIEEKCDELFVNCSDDMSKYKSKELAVNLAEFTQRWIPVEEELPEISEDTEDWFFEDDKYVRYSKDVLMKSNTGKVAVGCLCEDGCWVSDDIINTLNITHWRPIEIK